MTTLRLPAHDGRRFVATCTASESVGDLVYMLPDGTVRKCDIADGAKMPARGIIISKPSTTSAIMVTAGAVPFTVTLGRRYFVGPTGQPSATPPTSGLVQVIGEAHAPGQLLIRIEPMMAKRIP